ncbi:hypothetical protein ACWC2K_31770 [Streptomyces chattanoogensis]
MAMMLGLVLLLRPAAARKGTSTRPRTAGSGLLRLLALGSCPAFLVLALTSKSFGAQRSAAAYLFAVVGVWVTLPWVIGWAASRSVSGYQTFGETPATVGTGPVSAIISAAGLQAVVFTDIDKPMDIPAVKRAAHLHLSVKALTEPVAEDGAKSFAVGCQSRWIPFLGTIGTLILLTAMALAALSEFLQFAQTLAPLTVLTGRGQVFHTTALWCLGAPLLGAGAIGTFVHVVLVQPVTGGESGATLSWNLITAVLTATVLLTAAATAAGGSTAARRALTWRPRAD